MGRREYNVSFQQDLLPRFTNEDEQIRRFETHNFDGSLPHLKTIKIINYYGLLSEDNFVPSFVKYVLKNATTLETFVIAVGYEEHEMSQDDIPHPRGRGASKLSNVLFASFYCLFLLDVELLPGMKSLYCLLNNFSLSSLRYATYKLDLHEASTEDMDTLSGILFDEMSKKFDL